VTYRRKTTIAAAAVLAVSMTSCILLLMHIDKTRPLTIVDDSLYISSPKLVKRASLGFDGLMACIYWTRAVQYFGHRHYLLSHSYNELAPLLGITTTLDPHLLPAYEFGATFLAPAPPNGAGQPDRAIQLMQYGIEHNPDEWHLYYDLGFVYYTEFHDYKKAGEVFARGATVPNAHPFLKVLAAQMAEHAEDFATARLLWTAAYETSKDKDIRQNALEHLRAIKVDEDVTNLQIAMARFNQNEGRFPTSMWELAAAEHLPGLPVDPDGNAYELTLDGRVLVANPDDFSFITRGLPPGYKPGPPRFHTRPDATPIS
jgi:tetratricopeptide (TPR) repeat protein